MIDELELELEKMTGKLEKIIPVEAAHFRNIEEERKIEEKIRKENEKVFEEMMKQEKEAEEDLLKPDAKSPEPMLVEKKAVSILPARITKKVSNGENYAVEQRFGAVVTKELWGVVPFALYKYQKTLGLSIADVWFLAWVLMHQWSEADAFPSLSALFRYSGKSRGYIQKIAHRLRERGLLVIKERKLDNGAIASNFYDTEPFIKKLEEIIQEDKRARQNS